MKKNLLTIVLVSALIIISNAQTNYYVSPSGDDNNSGLSLLEAWRTIQKAADELKAGETVFIAPGIYNEQVVPQNSGTPDKPITYTALYNPENNCIGLCYPVIDGSDIELGWWGGILQLYYVDYITIQGLKIINSDFAAIFVNNCNNINIKNNKTVHSKSSGIYVRKSSNILVDSNIIRYSNNGKGQECISIVGVNNFEVTNNEVYDGVGLKCGEGIDIKTDSAAHTTHTGTVHRNYIHDLPGDVGIYIGAYAYGEHLYNVDVYNNIVTTDIGIAVSSERGGLTEDVKIYNNIAYNNYSKGIQITDWMHDEDEREEGPKKNISIFNNTIYNAGNYDEEGEPDGGSICIQNKHPESENFRIYNNIVSQGVNYQILLDSGAVDISTIEYNLIDGFRGNDTGETKGDFYQEGNPGFVCFVGTDPCTDFHLLPSSIAIDNGTSVDAPSHDYDGVSRPQGKGYDIGAYEYVRFYIDENSKGSNKNENNVNNNFDDKVNDYAGISIYPNPTNNEITINFPASEKHRNVTKVEITDITGKTIYNNQYTTCLPTGKIYNNQLQVDLSSFKSGIYIIRIKTDNDVFTSKIVKK